MGEITKNLKKMSGLKAGMAPLYLTTYREEFHISAAYDKVVVELAKSMFPSGKMPAEVTVKVEWKDEEQESTTN